MKRITVTNFIVKHGLGMAACLFLHFTAVAQTRAIQTVPGHVPGDMANLKLLGPLPATNYLNFAIALPVRHPEELNSFVQSVSDRSSPNYRHYLTPQQFAERFGPSQADYNAVLAFCQSNRWQVVAAHPNRMLVDVSGSVTDVERGLHVKMNVYQHPTEARLFHAPDRAPSFMVNAPVLDISGLDDYALPKPLYVPKPAAKPQLTPTGGSGPNGTYMGNDFRAAYAPSVSLTGTGQAVALVQFDGYTAADIAYYASQAGLPNVPLQNVLLDGFNGNPVSGGAVEVSLDIEMAMSMAPGLSQIIVYEGGPAGNWHDVLNRIATDNLASQVSCSWYIGGGGPDPVAEQIFQQMGAQGQSFFSASGDYDAYTGLIPFPCDSPSITIVGGTSLTTAGPGGAYVSETVWNWGDGTGGGGGISTTYPVPSWQQGVATSANGGSSTMRNIPDVALTADNVDVRVGGGDMAVGGTSCAAPLWAGFTALVNEEAAQGGKPPMGFINPAIYAIGEGSYYNADFNDILTGNDTSPTSPNEFYATPGYDLCTGWGTPAGMGLIDSLASPGPLLVQPLSGFTATGVNGGPFSVSSQTFTLSNPGANAVNWTAANAAPWLTVTPIAGTLAPGQSVTVTASLNSQANSLTPANYTATVVFTDLITSATFPRQFSLNVVPPPIGIQQAPGMPGCVVITWTLPGILQSSPTLGPGAVWTTIVGATSPYTYCGNGSQEFFRVVPTYYGNSLTQSGFEGADGIAPLVILGEYSPTGPLPNSSVTLPAGMVHDVQFYGGDYNFTLYALSLVSTGTNSTGGTEQTFAVTASQSFSDSASVGPQTLPVSNFAVSAGELLAFAGVGPYYPQSPNDALNSDATYEYSSNPDSFMATPPGGPGTQFVVGLNPDSNANYEYIPDYFGNQGRTYAIGVDVWPQ